MSKDDVAPLAPGAGVLQPYKDMLESTSYERLRAEHPAEFAPASVFFTHDPRSAIDRRNSFRVKAALVYEAVTGHHDHDRVANGLLLALADECHSRMIQQPAADAGVSAKGEEGAQNKDKDKGDGDAQKKDGKEDTASNAEGGGGGGAQNDKGKGLSKGVENQKGRSGSEFNPPPAEAEELTDERWEPSKKRVVDCIFLVVGFLPKLKEAIDAGAGRDGVDSSFRSRLMHGIVTDVVKLENQLPLRDLLAVARHVGAVINSPRLDFDGVAKGEYRPAVTDQNLGDVIHGFCWYYSPFAGRNAPAADNPFKAVATDAKMATRTLLDCLHMSAAPARPSGGAGGSSSRMPTARELRRSGVRLQAVENGRAEVEFAQSSTVRLPALVYDFKLATVARNLLAREYEEQSKPITRYFQMMNEIVEDVADARILRRAGLLRGGSRGAQEVHQLVKDIDGNATYPSVFVAMDREIEKVRKYHDQRMAKFFVRNRPGVIWASSVAAISVVAVVAARRNRGSGEM